MKLLNFNPNRKLGFDLDRGLQFNQDRDLSFNVDRNLSFDLNRDLGFGKRGVVFRGYICSSCGGLVGPSARECPECGAVFESEESEKPKKAQKPPERPKQRLRFCHYCGYPISRSDSYCSHCGLRLSMGQPSEEPEAEEPEVDVLRLPDKKKGEKKTVTDWRDTGRAFEDFLE